MIGEITQNKLRDEKKLYISKNKINELNKYNLYQNFTIVWGQKVKNLNDILITDDAWKVIRMICNDWFNTSVEISPNGYNKDIMYIYK